MGGNSTTLIQLQKRAVAQADLQSQNQFGTSGAITPSECNGYINDSYSEIHDLLILRYGSDYFVRKFVFPLVANVEAYALPDDFMKSKAVYYLQSAGPPAVRVRLNQFMEVERTTYQQSNTFPCATSESLMYRLCDGSIEFAPPPSATGQIELRYVYCAPRLVNDHDKIEFQVWNGAEEYIVVDVAIKMRDKLKLDTERLNQRKVNLYKRIETVATDRDAGQPQRVTDVYTYGTRRRLV